MANSAGPSLAVPVVEDFEDASFDFGERYRYRAEQTPDAILHHQHLLSKEGETLVHQQQEVAYTVGSGQRGRSYIIRQGDLFFQSPITWYSGRQRWDLSPGFESRTWHFGRRIVDGCVQCHFGSVTDAETRHADRYHADPFIEASIGCERCHGPGGRHVVFHRSGESSEEDPIVNPGLLPPRERESVCYQCHLQGVERVLRYGRTEFDFRPGMDLSDVWSIFTLGESGVYEGMTDAVSQVQQMRSSVCFQRSEGRLGCISCHDPHGTPDLAERVTFYRARCLECHGEEKTPCSMPVAKRREVTREDSCIECHMPRLPTGDVPHTAQTDHRVLRDPMSVEETRAASDGVYTLFDGAESRMPESSIERAEGILMARIAADESDVLLAKAACEQLAPLVSETSDDVDLLYHLGTAYSVQLQTQKAKEFWLRVLDLEPQHEGALRQLAFTHHEEGEWAAAATYFEKLVTLTPWERDAIGRYVHVLGQLGRVEAGFELALEAVERFPDDYRLHGWLADVYGARGEQEKAEHHRKRMEALSPGG